jgi:hypothetical protein
VAWVGGAARRVPAVMMGDIGEEITEIELEPWPGEAPAEMPSAAPGETPAAEPAEPADSVPR